MTVEKKKPATERKTKKKTAKKATKRTKTAAQVEHSKKAKALAKYVEFGTVAAACRAVGIGRTTWYYWRTHDKEFDIAVQEAEETVADDLEQAAIARARQGKSDTLMIFLLKGLRPEKYKDRRELDVTHHDDPAETLEKAHERARERARKERTDPSTIH